MNDNLLTVSQWLKQASKQLTTAGIGTARLDALVLLSDSLDKNRAHLLAHPELKLTHEQQYELQKLLDRRLAHEPLAYIRGKTEFYGREFNLNKDVLEPRPESEAMFDLLKGLPSISTESHIIDVGTGSGALAITAKLEFPETTVSAIDINAKCLVVARSNAQKHHVNIDFIHSDLLTNIESLIPTQPCILLANLPYVPDSYQVNEAASHEPKRAIFGGADGLTLYRRLFKQLAELHDIPFFVFTEALPFQHSELENIARTQNFNIVTQEDFIQVFQNNL